jgi:hypothetical protein
MRQLSGLIVYLLSFCVGYWFVAGPSDGQVESLALGESGLVVEVRKTHAHLFLAEYDFELVLKADGKTVDTAQMSGDSGGYSRIDLFRVNSSTYAFRDHAQSQCLDLSIPRFESCGLDRFGIPIGYFDFDKTKTWRFILK